MSKIQSYKIGETVKIVSPFVFERVGYPLTRKAVKESFSKEDRKAVEKLLARFDIKSKYPPFGVLAPDYTDEFMDKLASIVIRRRGFGGPERRIYTIERPEIKDMECQIVRKKYVRTGNYVSGSSYVSYNGDVEYDYPYLDAAKSHVILQVISESTMKRNMMWSDETAFWIEANNVIRFR